jgi:hypothetical protein
MALFLWELFLLLLRFFSFENEESISYLFDFAKDFWGFGFPAAQRDGAILQGYRENMCTRLGLFDFSKYKNKGKKNLLPSASPTPRHSDEGRNPAF